MFNPLMSIQDLFLLTLGSFFILFTIRQVFIRRRIFACLYHLFLFCFLFIASMGGGGVQNDDYGRLEKFILLEKNHQLEEAKNTPENYDRSLRFDLKEFKNSDEFRNYIKAHDIAVDRAEAIFIGWLFAFLSEISVIFAGLLSGIFSRKVKNKP